MRRYRFIGDAAHGYEVQVRWRWLPVWVRAGADHTHDTVAEARAHARKHADFKPIEIVGVFPMNGDVQRMVPHVAEILKQQNASKPPVSNAIVGSLAVFPSSSLGAQCLTGGASCSLSRRSFSLLWRSRHRADRVERALDVMRRWFFAALIAVGLLFAGFAFAEIVDLPLAREAAL